MLTVFANNLSLEVCRCRESGFSDVLNTLLVISDCLFTICTLY